MADIDFLGTYERINPELGTVTYKIDFLTPDLLRNIESACEQKSRTRISSKVRFREMKTYGDQKAWYGSLKLILRSIDIPVTSENMEIYDEEMRRTIFPSKKIFIGGREIIKPMKMKEQTHEQMQRNIEILQERHSHLGIDFSRLGQC